MRRFLRAANLAGMLLLLAGSTDAAISTGNALWALGSLAAAPAVSYLIATRRKPEPESPPAPPRTARYPDGAPEGTCAVCGMDSYGTVLLGTYRGQPAHDTCVEWIGGDPGLPKTGKGMILSPGSVIVPSGGTVATITVAGGAGGSSIAGNAGGGGGASIGNVNVVMGTAPTNRRSIFDAEPWPLGLPDPIQISRDFALQLDKAICDAGDDPQVADLQVGGTYCLCGQHFTGSAAEIGIRMRVHQRSGECRVQEQAHR